MGQDKALIEIEGIPLLQRTCQIALACTPSVYVVTPWCDRYTAIVPPPCQLIQELPLPTTNEPAHGPLVGFAQGFAQIQTHWLLLLACDLPKLEAHPLKTGITQIQSIESKCQSTTASKPAIAYLPRGNKGWEPLCGFYHRRCLSDLNQFIQGGGRSFQQWLASQSVQPLDGIETKQLFNCNTPEDLTKIQNP